MKAVAVKAFGAVVDPLWIGQRVWAFAGLGGGYAERAVAAAETLVPLPAGLSAGDAVTLGSSGAVAHFGLRHARFAPGESVLVRGAAGGIGVMAVQLAARGGASAVAVTGPDLPSFFGRLNPNGRMVAVGVVAGYPPPDFGLELFTAFQKSMSFATFSTDTVPAADRRVAIAGLFAAAIDGGLRSVVHEQLPLDEAVLAHQKMAAGEVFGRIVLTRRPGRRGRPGQDGGPRPWWPSALPHPAVPCAYSQHGRRREGAVPRGRRHQGLLERHPG